MSPRVSVVIVCMNRPDNLCPCLESIERHTTLSHEVLVVAYLFDKAELAKVKSAFPHVSFIESDQIRGFSENNNLALRQAKGEYVLCLNDDTLLTEAMIDKLVADFDKLPSDAAILSPAIRFADGRLQTCGRPVQTACRYVLERYHLCSNQSADDTVGKSPYVDAIYRTSDINGACFMIRRNVFEELGWFDERYFFTPEDIALSTAARARNYAVYVDAGVNVTHFHHQSARRIVSATKPAGMRGFLMFYARGSAFRYDVLGVFVWLAEWLKYLFCAFRCLFSKEQALHIRKQTYAHCLCSIFTRKSPKEIFIKYYAR